MVDLCEAGAAATVMLDWGSRYQARIQDKRALRSSNFVDVGPGEKVDL